MYLKLKKFLLFAIICQWGPLVLLSQEKSTVKSTGRTSSIELVIFVGGQGNDLDGLNAKLSQFHSPNASNMLWNGGAGLRLNYNNIIFGADASILYKNANELGDILGSYIHAFISTKLLSINRILLFPEIGIGRQTINVNSRGQSSLPDFDDYMLIGRKDLSFYNVNTVVDIALCIRFRAANKKWNVPLFRAGYRNGLKETTWRVKSSDSQNGPVDRMSNFYLQIMFGITR